MVHLSTLPVDTMQPNYAPVIGDQFGLLPKLRD